jgi:hypothetical protein
MSAFGYAEPHCNPFPQICQQPSKKYKPLIPFLSHAAFVRRPVSQSRIFMHESMISSSAILGDKMSVGAIAVAPMHLLVPG